MGEAAKSGPLFLYQKVASPPTFTPHCGIHSVRSSGHSHNIRSPLVKIVKHPISKVNRSQISNIQTCHLVKYPISLISLTVGQPQPYACSRYKIGSGPDFQFEYSD